MTDFFPKPGSEEKNNRVERWNQKNKASGKRWKYLNYFYLYSFFSSCDPLTYIAFFLYIFRINCLYFPEKQHKEASELAPHTLMWDFKYLITIFWMSPSIEISIFNLDCNLLLLFLLWCPLGGFPPWVTLSMNSDICSYLRLFFLSLSSLLSLQAFQWPH